MSNCGVVRLDPRAITTCFTLLAGFAAQRLDRVSLWGVGDHPQKPTIEDDRINVSQSSPTCSCFLGGLSQGLRQAAIFWKGLSGYLCEYNRSGNLVEEVTLLHRISGCNQAARLFLSALMGKR